VRRVNAWPSRMKAERIVPLSLPRVVAAVAHAVRNPLAALTASLETLERRLDAATAEREALDRALAGAARIARCVDELVELATPPAAFPRAMLLDTWARRHAPVWRERAEEKGRPLVLQMPAGLPPVSADPSLLARVVGRLIEDALEASQDGRAVRVEAAAEGGRVLLSVVSRPDPARRVLRAGLGLTAPLCQAAAAGFGATYAEACAADGETRQTLELSLAKDVEQQDEREAVE
jgi:signal transduction histidine kinase